MQENEYIINGLKKEDSKRVKEHFTKHISFYRLKELLPWGRWLFCHRV